MSEADEGRLVSRLPPPRRQGGDALPAPGHAPAPTAGEGRWPAWPGAVSNRGRRPWSGPRAAPRSNRHAAAPPSLLALPRQRPPRACRFFPWRRGTVPVWCHAPSRPDASSPCLLGGEEKGGGWAGERASLHTNIYNTATKRAPLYRAPPSQILRWCLARAFWRRDCPCDKFFPPPTAQPARSTFPVTFLACGFFKLEPRELTQLSQGVWGPWIGCADADGRAELKGHNDRFRPLRRTYATMCYRCLFFT